MVSFRREKFVPRGGPSGGNGGRGGHVVFRANKGINTLAHLRPNATIRAEKGGGGGSNNRAGSMGDDAVVEVPLGTIVRNVENDEFIAELIHDGEEYIVAEGGRGGCGNSVFASSKQQTPRFAKPGDPGQVVKVALELKLLADVGFLGLPNAGKSTLTSRISHARPVIADYPFTTLYPVLGVVKMGWESLVIADIPGLIEGAHKGIGLGHQFLKHIERTRLLIHLVDVGTPDGEHPISQIETLANELKQFQRSMADKPRIIVANKIDLQPDADKVKELEEYSREKGYELAFISGVTGEGVDDLIKTLFEKLKSIPRNLEDLEEENIEERQS